MINGFFQVTQFLRRIARFVEELAIASTGRRAKYLLFRLSTHVGWRDTDQMFRVVTFGWGQMLSRLQGFADTGKPMPYFDF